MESLSRSMSERVKAMLEKLREQEAAYEAAKDDVARLEALLKDDN